MIKKTSNPNHKERISYWIIFFLILLYSFYWIYVFTALELSTVGNLTKILSLAIVVMSGYAAYLVWKHRVKKKIEEMGENMWEAIYRTEGVCASATFLFVYSLLALLISQVTGGVVAPIPPRRSNNFLLTESDLEETFFPLLFLISIILVGLIYPLGIRLMYKNHRKS